MIQNQFRKFLMTINRFFCSLMIAIGENFLLNYIDANRYFVENRGYATVKQALKQASA